VYKKGIVESHDQSEVFNGLASMSFEPAEADDINQIYYTNDAVSKVRRSKREDLDQGQSLITNDYMLGVIPKPKNAQGVSHELEELTKHSSYSLPLRRNWQNLYYRKPGIARIFERQFSVSCIRWSTCR